MDQVLTVKPPIVGTPIVEPVTIDDPETIRLVHEYAGLLSVGPIEAVKRAVSEARERDRQDAEARLARVRALVAELATWPNTGPPADKAFYDSLNDEEDDLPACS